MTSAMLQTPTTPPGSPRRSAAPTSDVAERIAQALGVKLADVQLTEVRGGKSAQSSDLSPHSKRVASDLSAAAADLFSSSGGAEGVSAAAGSAVSATGSRRSRTSSVRFADWLPTAAVAAPRPCGSGKELHPTLADAPVTGEEWLTEPHAAAAGFGSSSSCGSGASSLPGPSSGSSSDAAPVVPRQRSQQSRATSSQPADSQPADSQPSDSQPADVPHTGSVVDMRRRRRAGKLHVCRSLFGMRLHNLVWKERFVDVHGGKLSVFRKEGDAKARQVIPVSEVQAVGPTRRDVGGREYCFAVVTREGITTFQARNTEHCQQWCDFFGKLLAREAQLQKRRGLDMEFVASMAPTDHRTAPEHAAHPHKAEAAAPGCAAARGRAFAAAAIPAAPEAAAVGAEPAWAAAGPTNPLVAPHS